MFMKSALPRERVTPQAAIRPLTLSMVLLCNCCWLKLTLVAHARPICHDHAPMVEIEESDPSPQESPTFRLAMTIKVCLRNEVPRPSPASQPTLPPFFTKVLRDRVRSPLPAVTMRNQCRPSTVFNVPAAVVTY